MNGHGSLNRIFRVVWNVILGEWQVASEHTRGKGKTKSMRLGGNGFARLTAGSILVLCHAGALAELPTGGQVTAGSGQIGTPSNGHLVINQDTGKMVIDWNSFSIGQGNSVQFIQPSAEAIALNRVLGGDPSIIRGTISANGRVVLLNPNGILFGPTSKVEVASLLASTLNMSNEDFMAGNFRLEGDSPNAVINQGSIKAADGGFVALVAAKIENVGDISVRGGEVLMGFGRKVRLDLGGPARIEIDEAAVDAYIRNGGLIRVDGGSVIMTVKTAGELASQAINNEGIIEATSLARGDGGTIRLLADGGTVTNSGTLNVSAADGKGGHIEVTGARVGILDGSVVDASGATGGGTVLLGGDYQGKNAEVANAQMTFVGEGATVRANATDSGDGGKVIVWSDDRTAFSGTIEAKGGTEGGNGGFVEVSGKQFLDFQGTVDTTAAKGKTGTLLLDPTNLTIGKVNTSGWITQQGGTFADFTSNTAPDPAHDFSFLRVDVLEAALATNDITVQSACATAECVGTITVKDAVTWSSGKGLTLDATGSIFINADITSVGANGIKGGDFNAHAASGNIEVNANITTVGGAATTGAGLAGGSVNLNAADGSVLLANHAVINTGGSAAATGSVAVGGAAGAININSTTGIALNNGDLLAAGGASTGTAGAGGLIHLSSTTGNISQGSGSRIVGGRLKLETDSGSVTLNNGSNEVAAIAALSNSGNIQFNNLNTAGLTVTNIGGVNGVTTGGAGFINLSARNLQINSDISTNTGSITLNASHGQQVGDFNGVAINGAHVATQDGNISVAGRGGNAATGNQSGVVLTNGASVNAGGAGNVTVTGQGGTNAGDNNHGVAIGGGVIAATGSGTVGVTGTGGAGTGSDNYGVLLAGTGAADTGLITSASGAITVTATGGNGVDGDNNHAIVFADNGQIGDASGNRNVTIKTTVGEGANSVAYSSDAAGGYIGTGEGSLTLTGDVLSANRLGAVAVRTTGNLTLQSLGGSFTNPFSLTAFTDNFLFNGGGAGFNNIGNLAIGKAGNTAGIEIDQALSLANRSITLIGGAVTVDENITASSVNVTSSGEVILNKQINTSAAVEVVTSDGDVRLNDQITAGTSVKLKTTKGDVDVSGQIAAGTTVTLEASDANTASGGNVGINQQITASNLSITASNDITQTLAGGFAATSSTFTSTKGDITLDGQNNQTNNLSATATDGAITFNNGSGNALSLNGNLTAKSVHLNAKLLNQTGGTITTDALEVTSANGGVSLNQNNNVKTIAADVNGGDFTFNNNGNALAIGLVGSTNGVSATGTATFNGISDMEIGSALVASAVTINAISGRNVDLGTETAGQLSLTDAEMDRITANSLTLNTTGKVTNSANVRAAGLSAMTINATQGIVNSGSGQLGFSGTETGSLTLTTTGTDAGMGIGSSANALVTVGASSLTLSSARDIRVDARTNAGGSGSANLDKLHINSTSAGENFSYGVASTASLGMTVGAAPSWYQGPTPAIKGTYNISLTNSDALDFRFIGNAPIRVNGVSNIGAANFALESIYGINVANAITGTSGTISLKANSGSVQGGNFTGVNVAANITTGGGSIVIDGRGGNGRNAGDFSSDQSDQYGVNIASTVSATAGGSISITGNGGSSSSSGANHDGVVISGAVTASGGGNIAINGTGGSGNSLGTTSDGIVFNGTGYVSNAAGNVSLTGKSGSGISSRAIAQDGTGIITAGGLEVISTQSGEVGLTNNNNVAVLAGNVTTGFSFDNGGRAALAIGTVNGSVGLAGSGTLGLYDIGSLTVNESILASGSNLAIAADAMSIAADKSIRGGSVWLTGKTNKGGSWNPTASRAIDVGGAGGGSDLAFTTNLLDNIYASSQLTLATSGATTLTADTFFKNTNSLVLQSGGAITSTGTNWLVMSGSSNQGSLTFNGSAVGEDSREILVQGANNISASSAGVINARAFTQGGGGLIDLKSVSISSTSGGANLKYNIEGAGLTYGITGNGSGYAIAANATDDNTVDFSFTGNASTTVSSTDTNGGSFSANATSGNLTVVDTALIKASNVNLKSAGNITLTGSAAIDAASSASFVSSGTNSIFATGTGNVNAGSKIEIKTDAVVLGAGLLTAGSEISVNPVTSTHLIQLGGGADSNLSLSAAELAQMSADKLVIGRNNANDQISSAINIVGAVDLTGKFSTLSLNSHNSGGVTQNAALTVDKLDVSLKSGAVTLTNAANNIRTAALNTDGAASFTNTGALTFSSIANGAVTVNNTGSLNIAGINSNGGSITANSSGDLLVSSAVTATETATGTNADGAEIKLESTGGSLIVNAGIASNGYSSSGNSRQNGGSIILRGQDVTIGSGSAVSITANGTGGGNTTSTGGNAGSVNIASTQAGGDVALTNTTISVNAGSGGYSGGGGAGGAAGTVTLTAAAGGDISLTGGSINLNGAGGGGTAGSGAGAGTFNLNASGSGTVSATNTSITLNGGNGSGTGIGGSAGTVTATGSSVALAGTSISLNGGSGGGTGAGGNGGSGGTLTLNSAASGEVSLTNANLYLNGGSGGGTSGNGGNAGTLSIPAFAAAKTILNSGSISLVGGSGGTNGSRGTGRNLTFSNQVLLGAGSFDINAGGGNVRFASAVDGDVDVGTLTIRSSRTSGGTTTYGTLTFDQAVGATSAIGNLTAHSVQSVSMVAINASGNVSLSPVGNATLGTVNAGSLSITNVDGTTTLSGPVNTTGSNGININTKTLLASGVGYTTTGGGDIKLATKDALNLLDTSAFNSSGSIDLTATDGITISGSMLTTEGKGINFHSKTVLKSDVKINTTANNALAGGDVSFMSTLDSDSTTRALTINAGTDGNVKFDGAVGATAALGAITIESANNVTATDFKAASFAQQSGGGATTLNGTTDLTGSFAFAGNALTVNGALTASQVAVNNAGQFTTGGGSSIAAAGGFAQAGTGAVKLGGSITTTETDITFASPVTVNGTVALSTGATGDGDISFAGTLDNATTANAGSTTLTAGAGQISFGGNIGATTALGNLTINSSQDVELPVSVKANTLTTDAGGSTIIKNGTLITTIGKQEYGDAVTLTGNATLASGGNVIFSNTLNGGYDLAINGAGITRFGGAVGNINALNNLLTDANGTVEINGGGITTVGNQTYGEQVTLGADATLTSNNGGNITFGSSVNGAHALTVATNGNTTFHGAVGSTNALASIAVANQAGTLMMNGGSFKTTGAQTYNSGTIILGGDTLLASSAAGTINLAGKVDAAICTIAALDVQTQGATIFGGAVGTYRPLWSITTDGLPSATNTVTFQQGTVITHGDQRYGETVILGANTKLTSYGQGDIVFGGPVRAKDDGQQSLTINTSGDIEFNGPVGDNNQRLASLDTSLSTDGKVGINGGGVTTVGAQTYGAPVTLGNDAVLESTNNGDIVFGGTVDGAHDLTIKTNGTTRFAQAVGGTTALASLTTSGTGNVLINGGSVKTVGEQTYDNAVILGANTVLTSTDEGDITFNRTVDGARALTVATGGDTTFNGAVGGRTALANLTTDADGDVIINGGLVRTSGAQTFNDGVTVGANTVFSSNGPITFAGTLDGPHDVTVKTPGATTFGGAIGSIAPLANLYGGTGAGIINIHGPSIALTGSLIFEEAVHVKGATTVQVGGDALFYGDARTGKSLLNVTAGGRIQYGRPMDNIKNYLPTLFSVGNQNANALPKLNPTQQPVSVALLDNASSQQMGVGNLQMVNLTSSAPGGTDGRNVSDSAVDQTVNRIAADDNSRSMTYIVTVDGGVRVADETTEEAQ